ncbi:IS3 family transposase [Spiroplasma ixodetis]|uniref:HTH-like domain-containing protein n=1 Tax=Spiroplasma ixodetis TaxID=2141 RepID=A0ABM8JL63_9MOLU
MQKIEIITKNKVKYKIRTMCCFLKISKSTYYFNFKKKEDKIQNNMYDEAFISAFKENKEAYGTRRLKVVLKEKKINLSRRKIKKIMNKHNLIWGFLKICVSFYKVTSLD